jgi:flagellin-like protein
MSRRLCADKRGISPVVATVILVAVTIVVAVAVAYWMGGIAGLYTRYEKLEISSIYAESTTVDSTEYWNITVSVKNTGSADATIDNVLVNGRAFSQYSPKIQVNGSDTTINYPLKVGQELILVIGIEKEPSGTISPNPWPFKSGVSVEVRLHSAGGQEYPKTVTLP